MERVAGKKKIGQNMRTRLRIVPSGEKGPVNSRKKGKRGKKGKKER